MAEATKQRRRATLGGVAQVLNGKLTGDESREVLDVTHDSRQAKEGSLFVAVRGAELDAHRFVEQVMKQGAVGVISELEAPAGFNGAWLEVTEIRRAMALAAATIHDHPSRELQLVGITGTNGKTTTTYLVASIADSANEPVAMTTTVEYRVDQEHLKAERTTPEGATPEQVVRGTQNPNTMPVVDRIALDRAIAQLPPGYREVFMLHDVEGHDHEEIGQILGVATGTSKSQLHKARMKLRRLLREQKTAPALAA